jgi:hypothetical protein
MTENEMENIERLEEAVIRGRSTSPRETKIYE